MRFVTSDARALRRAAMAAAASCTALVVVPSAARAQAAPDSAQAALERSDQIRNPQQPFQVTLDVVEYRSGQPRESASLRLYSKPVEHTRRYRNLARYTAPAADDGKILLLDDRNLWYFDPASAASIRISPQQRLLGQVSNGDVMTANLALDYRLDRSTDDTIKDADNQQRGARRLELSAASPSAMYARIEYWIDAGSSAPIKARFYADSGNPLKLAYYRRYSQQLGELRPTEMIILDEVDRSLVTKIAMNRYADRDTPDGWFNREFLPRLRPGDARNDP